MDNQNFLARQFEAHRRHLQRVAYRMLGSSAEADDAVQEAWLRLSRSEVAGIDNLGGWLTTVVARVCLDTLRSRKARREEPLDGERQPNASPLCCTTCSTFRSRRSEPLSAVLRPRRASLPAVPGGACKGRRRT